MSSLVHGIELDAHGKPAWQHFGIVNLLLHLEGTKVTEQSLQDWVARFRFGQPFWHEWRHFYNAFASSTAPPGTSVGAAVEKEQPFVPIDGKAAWIGNAAVTAEGTERPCH
jgi:hypothetical protein